MGRLRIYLLGTLRIIHDGHPEEMKLARSVRGLFAYLVLFRERIHARETLSGLFWGDSSEDRAHSSLSTALWRLRKTLEPKGIPRGTYLLSTGTGEVGFNRQSDYWLDVAEFESRAAQILAKPCQTLAAGEVCGLEDASALYTGDLLEGFYDDWALSERERIRSLYVKSQAHLLGYHRHKGDYDRALACGHYILNMDPLREEIHREMMRLYVECGRRTQALKQYESCCNMLKTELGVSPMEETRALCAEIIKASAPETVRSLSQGGLGPARHALQQLNEALGSFDEAAGKIRRAGEILEELIEE